MNTWKVVCATLVIFLAGIITEATLVRVAQRAPRQPRNVQPPFAENRMPSNPANPNSPNDPRPANAGNPSGLLSREFIQVLERQLRLTSEQRERIDKIMADGQERVRDLRARIDPEMRKELQQTREQIRSVLTPEQREQFEQLMKRGPRRNDAGEMPGPPDRRFRDQRDQREPRNQPPPPMGGSRESQPPPQPPDP